MQVTIAFGVLHLAEPLTALAEAGRVLRPGGRVAFSVRAAGAARRCAACFIARSSDLDERPRTI